MDESLVAVIWGRAKSCCEYCKLPADCSDAPFQIDHIISRKHHGTDELGNLALACFYCNSYKGPNIAGLDPLSGRLVRLFHPRRDNWSDHFAWEGPLALGRSGIGRATIDVLWINHPVMVELRRWLIVEGRIL